MRDHLVKKGCTVRLNCVGEDTKADHLQEDEEPSHVEEGHLFPPPRRVYVWAVHSWGTQDLANPNLNYAIFILIKKII